MEFRKELTHLLNSYSKENGSNTPDFILAEYLNGCLNIFDSAIEARAKWYGHMDVPGGKKIACRMCASAASYGLCTCPPLKN